MSEQDEIALLRAQLVQCTTAMREAVNTMENTNLAFAPDMEGSIRRVTDLLKTARGSAVTHDQIEQFRAGEWQKARQEAERLEREVKLLQDENKARLADQDAAIAEWRVMKDQYADIKAQLETTQKALVEEGAKNDFPNPPLQDARARVETLGKDLFAADSEIADLKQRLVHMHQSWEEQLKIADGKHAAYAKHAAEDKEQWRRRAEDNAQACEAAQLKLSQASKIAALLTSIVGDEG